VCALHLISSARNHASTCFLGLLEVWDFLFCKNKANRFTNTIYSSAGFWPAPSAYSPLFLVPALDWLIRISHFYGPSQKRLAVHLIKFSNQIEPKLVTKQTLMRFSSLPFYDLLVLKMRVKCITRLVVCDLAKCNFHSKKARKDWLDELQKSPLSAERDQNWWIDVNEGMPTYHAISEIFDWRKGQRERGYKVWQ